MPSRKEAQSGRIGHRKDRRHSSTERVNTTRADDEQQINAVDDLPALDAMEFSTTESPTLRRLQHPAYELSEGPAVNQSHIPLFQRPKSSVPLPKDEDFTFGARQDRQINVRIGRQQQIRPKSLTEISSQRIQSAEKANETPDVIPPKEKHSTLPVKPSNPAEIIPKDSTTTIRIDLTRESPSAALQTIKPMNTIRGAQSQQEKICQEPSANIKHGPPSDNFVRNGFDEAALCYTHPLSMEAQPRSPLNIMPIEHKGNAPSEKHSQNVHHSVQAINVPLLFSEAASPPVACGQTNLLSPTAGHTDVSKKETQSYLTPAIDPPATPTLPPDARYPLLNVSQQRTAREVNPMSIERIQLAASKEGRSVPSLTEETLGSDASHTPRTNARRAGENPMRVCKVAATPQRALQPATLVGQQATELQHVTAVSNGPIAPSRGTLPSEEDLFYLLMHRQRQRKDAETRVMVRQKQLETANARLGHQNENLQRQLSVACTTRDQSAAEASLQKAAMEDFKARFQKLKGFVNGLINDYSALRQQADQMRNSQQSLINEKEHLYRELQDFQIASAASERAMSNIVSTVAKVRQGMGPLEQSLVDSKKALEGESHILSKEQKKNKRLETYLLQVATTQNRYSLAIQNEQKAILDQLRDITSRIHIVEKATTAEPQPLQLPGLDECVRMLTKLHDADRVVPADINQVTDAVRTLSQSVSLHWKSLDESIQTAGDDQIKLGNQLVAQITTLLESFHATFVEKEQLSNLREDKLRLEEQLKSSENVVQEIRDSRASADTRESHLRNITDSLLNELKTLRNQPLAAHKHRPQVDERDMISTWQMKYTTICQKLTDSEEHLNRKEKEIRQGEEDVEKLSGQLERVRAERDIAVQALSEAEDRRSADQSGIGKLQQTLADKESGLEALHVEVKSSNTKIREEADKAKELADLQMKHQAELEDVKSELNSANQRHERANQQVQELKQSLKGFAEAQQEAAKVAQLTEELQQEHAKVLNLHQEITPLEGIARQVPGLKQQVSEKQRTIESLENRIKEAETSSIRIAKMEQNALQSAKEISALKVKLRTVEESANSAGEQKEGFGKTIKEAEEPRKKLVDLQPLVNRFSALQEEDQGHLDEVICLQQELSNAKSSIDQLHGLRETSRRSSAEIVSLQEQVSAADSELKRLQSVKDVCDRKDQEMVTLNARLRAAEDNLIHFQGLEEAIRDKDEHIITLNRELDAAKDSLKHLKGAQNANGRKDEEIASLKQRLEATESILNDVQVVKEESQRKEVELLALKDKLAKIEETSQQLLQTLAERPSHTHGASQRMIAIRDGVTIEGRNFPAGPAVTGVSSRDLAHQPRCQANWNDDLVHTQALQTAIAEIVRIDSKGIQSLTSGQIFDTTESSHPAPIVDPEILRTRETTFVPESQPVADSPYEGFPIEAPYFDSMSSPLANIDPFIASSDEVHHQSVYFGPEKIVDGSPSTFTKVPANFRPSPRLSVSSQKDPPSSRPPSSSYGDAMLLEAEEELRNLGQHGATAVQESSAQRSGPQSGSTNPGRPLAGKSRGISRSRIQKPSSKTAKTKSKRNPSVSPKHPSPRRLRSESQTRSKMIMPLEERALSDQNIPVSPLREMLRDKHVSNSAAKRQLEGDEMRIPSSSHHGSKRLKRNLSALEIKTPTNQKGPPFLNQVTPATGTGRLNHPSMPTGGRKGSIVGTNAPAPCTGQHTNKKPRKNSKTGRYSVQFGKETT